MARIAISKKIRNNAMITFPNAKINLGLNIVEKRPDGYHNLETVFYPVALEDALEINEVPNIESEKKCQLHQYGTPIAGNPEDNLVMKAYRLLNSDFRLPPIEIHLYKHIPSGAGLGGGSSDAAFMLKLLNEKFGLGLSDGKLEDYAVRLGADCPFFIADKPVYAEGTGNLFSPIPLSLKGYRILLIKPDIFVSTREAFSHITPQRPAIALKEVVNRPVIEWKELMVNDFEKSVFPQHPQIEAIKNELYQQGAVYAAMSGSGSSVFGLFEATATIPNIKKEGNVFTYQGVLQ